MAALHSHQHRLALQQHGRRRSTLPAGLSSALARPQAQSAADSVACIVLSRSSSHRRVDLSSVLSAASTATTSPALDMSKALSLENIRSSLIRQEDTIIFNLIERAQFARNDAVYTPDAIPVPVFGRDGKRYSLLQYVLREQEQLHGRIRRYTSPDQHPFFPDETPPLVLPPITYPAILAPCADQININDKIMKIYLDDVLPDIAAPGDDYNYGSASTLDVLCLQALSQRIHYGKFVAEAKFREQPEEYSALIRARDADGIMALLTDKVVEQKVVERVRLKAATFGQDLTAPTPSQPQQAGQQGEAGPRYKVAPDLVARLYEKWVMPLTKEVEVEYLLRRLDHLDGPPSSSQNTNGYTQHSRS